MINKAVRNFSLGVLGALGVLGVCSSGGEPQPPVGRCLDEGRYLVVGNGTNTLEGPVFFLP